MSESGNMRKPLGGFFEQASKQYARLDREAEFTFFKQLQDLRQKICEELGLEKLAYSDINAVLRSPDVSPSPDCFDRIEQLRNGYQEALLRYSEDIRFWSLKYSNP